MDNAKIAGIDPEKAACIKIVHEIAEAAGEFIRNKIAEQFVKPETNSRNVEKIVIPPRKGEERNIK